MAELRGARREVGVNRRPIPFPGRCLLGLLPLLLAAGAQAQIASDAEPQPVMRLQPGREAALLLGGALAHLGGVWLFNQMPGNAIGAFSRRDLWGVDGWAAGAYGPGYSLASDILVIPVVGALPLLDAWLAWSRRTSWSPFWTDAVVLTEALAWSSALNLTVRSWRWHPRPLVFSEAAPKGFRMAPEAGGSFYSGHANGAFTGAVLFALVAPKYFPACHPAWFWGGALGSATLVASLRVAAGKHYPTDVIAGAAAGSLFAYGFFQWHRARPQAGEAQARGWRLSPAYPLGLTASHSF